MTRSSMFAVAASVVVWILAVSPARAQEESHAGLVIVHGDGRVTQQCVAFAETTISGYELLKRAGPAMSVEAGAIGATICSIDGEGCAFPQESCFCQCQGSPCTYWSYWRQSAAGWQYQNLGAANTKVRAGDVEAWHWATGTPNDAEKPPDLTFDAICAAEPKAQAVAAALTITASTSPETRTAQAMLSSTVTPAGAAVTTPVAAAPGGPLGVLWLVLLGLVVLPFAAGAVLILVRKQQGQ